MFGLSTASSNYVNSWEGLSAAKGDKYNKLRERIENATISEILTQYNINCIDKSWNEPLSEIYSQELLERILSDATFSIMTVWRSINLWLQSPYITVQLGFDEDYPILDEDNEPILEDDPVALSFILNNDQFTDEIQRNLIHKFLTEKINATIQVESDKIYVTKIGDVSVSKSQITKSMRLVQIANSTELNIPMKIYYSPDLYLLYLMMNNIREKNYEIIDLYGRYEKELIIQEYFNLPESNSLPPVDELIDKNNLSELWKKIHITALKCNNLDKFSEWIWEVVKNLPCDCKWHALLYIQRNSPTDLVPTSSNSDISISFYWSWQFHNDVNKRLEKPEFPYEEALLYYTKLI